MPNIFKDGGGAGIGSYVVVFKDGQLAANTDLLRLRGAYESGEQIYFSIDDAETKDALVPASGWIDEELKLHLVARDFDDNKTYAVSLGDGATESEIPVEVEVKDGIEAGGEPLGGGSVEIAGNSLVIPEQPAPEPVITIDGVEYFHEIDTKDIELPTENGTTYLYNLSGNLIKTDVKPALPYISVSKLNDMLEMKLMSSDYDYMGNANIVLIFDATSALINSGVIPVQAASGSFSLNEAYFTAGYLQVDADTHNSIIYFNLTNEGPEYIDSIKQGNSTIPLRGKDVRLPDATAADVGKVLAVNDQGELILQTPQAGGVKLYKHNLSINTEDMWQQCSFISIEATSVLDADTGEYNFYYTIINGELNKYAVGTNANNGLILSVTKVVPGTSLSISYYDFDSNTKTSKSIPVSAILSDTVTPL